MTISSELTKLNTNMQNAYTACDNKGATLPQAQNMDNLATCISSISGGSSPVISSLSITPTTSQQTITAPSGTDGYSPITVSAVTSSIDANITAGNIKSGVSILGVTGNYSGTTPTLTTKNITANGTYNASSDNADGYSSVTVNVSGGGGTGIPREVKNGVYQQPTENFTFSLPSDATEVSDYGLYCAFRECTGLTSVDLSSLTTVSGYYGMYVAFYKCASLTSVDLSSLTTVSGRNGLYGAFQDCTSLTSVDLSALTTVSSEDYGLYYVFAGCTALTSIDLSSLTTVSGQNGLASAFRLCTALTSIDLSSLTTVSGQQAFYYTFQSCSALTSIDLSSLTTVSGSNGLKYAFYYCTALTSVDLPLLTTVSGSSGLSSAFYNCKGLTDIYFRALTTSSFGSYTNQFSNMMQNTGTTTTHTLHFPSNLQSTISGLSGYPLFGGSSGYVTLAFDLPATS